MSRPNVADVLDGWLQTLHAKKMTQTIVNGDIEETETPVTFRGMEQVQSPYQLSLHAEGERSWNWVDIYCDYADFELDDIIILADKEYRVMKKDNWQEFGYGYYKYECVRDYNNEQRR